MGNQGGGNQETPQLRWQRTGDGKSRADKKEGWEKRSFQGKGRGFKKSPMQVPKKRGRVKEEEKS